MGWLGGNVVTKIRDSLLTYSGLVIGWPGAVLLQYHHVPLVALDLVQGLLGLGMSLPGPASLQMTVLVVLVPAQVSNLSHQAREVIVVSVGVTST